MPATALQPSLNWCVLVRVMGLLDKAKAETEKYIEVDLFLYYLAFSQNETLDNVLTWLRNNYFENDITSYEIDENYRIEPNLENPNIDNQTALLMDMLQIDGLFNYFMYLSHYQDGLDFEQYFYDGYKPVHTNFYYEINDLNKLKYIKELGIDFYNAKKYSFTINSHDEVKAELRLDSRLEKLVTFTSKTIDKDNPFSPTQEPQKYHILETLRYSQKNEISHDLSNNSELLQQLQATIDRQAKEITQLKAQIAELEQQAGKVSDTPASEPLKGIAKVNYDKDRAKAFARIVAKFLWDMDTTEQIKSGDMANQIYALLVNFNDGATPETTDTIKEWLAEIAPAYAKSAGRPPKNQPREIPLTLKK